MNYYGVVQGVNSLFALAIFLVVLFRKPTTRTHLTYLVWVLFLFLWTFSYFIWSMHTTLEQSVFWLKTLIASVSFIHMAFFHFNLAFTENKYGYRKRLIGGYIISFFFMLIALGGYIFDAAHARVRFGFLYWPRATPWLGLLIAVETYYVLLSIYLIIKYAQKTPPPLKNRTLAFLLTSTLAWIGGLTNWIGFYDIATMPPWGNPAVTLYLLCTFYLIFKHDILNLNIVIKKTFLYTVLTLFITITYTLVIVLFERVFQSYAGYRSLVGTLLAAITIAFLFNPARSFITKLLDKIFFGKDIEGLSTERSLMMGELQKQAQLKAVATLASGMAHEIKNPLTAIKTFTEHLPQKSHDPEFISKFSKIVGSEVDKIDGIVKELLEFSKPTTPKLEKIDILQPIEETLEFLNNDLLKHGIRTEKDYPPSPAWISGDKKQLKQVFLNLFLNAIQAMPRGGTLSVDCRRQTTDSRLVVTISDTGCGIPKENLTHIFDPFFTTKDDGTGLGLSIVHGIIAKHGGEIKAESDGRTGTTIKIWLPTTVG